jgi:23S rRNA (guanosine2251-2'-O)-methyltransferase
VSKLDKIYGLHAVVSLLRERPEDVQQLWLQKGRDDKRSKEVVALANKHNIRTEQINRALLDQMVSGRHQGVVAEAVASRTEAVDERRLPELIEAAGKTALLLVLDGVTDPHNLGACIRSADAAGACAVIAPKDKSASLTDTAKKVACGAAETVPYIQVTNLARTLRDLQEAGVWLIGTAGEAEQVAYEVDMRGPVAIVMGAEGDGLRRLTRECCDYLVKLPMAGAVSSLNVSVAAGVTLFEVVRQRYAG